MFKSFISRQICIESRLLRTIIRKSSVLNSLSKTVKGYVRVALKSNTVSV